MEEKRIVITMRTKEDFKASIKKAAHRAGVTLTAYILSATREQMNRDVLNK